MQLTDRLLHGLGSMILGLVVVVVGVAVTAGKAFTGAPLCIVVGLVLFVHGMLTTGTEALREIHDRERNSEESADLSRCC